MDNGLQPVRWIGCRTIDAIDLISYPKLCPVRIKRGALGRGLPERDLLVSRQHRLFIRSKIARRMFGTNEILIPAIKMVGYEGIEIVENAKSVTYWHLLFDRHEVIFTQGAPTESLYTGAEAMKGVSLEARREIETLFPQITDTDSVTKPARPIIQQNSVVKQLARRHEKHGKTAALTDPRPADCNLAARAVARVKVSACCRRQDHPAGPPGNPMFPLAMLRLRVYVRIFIVNSTGNQGWPW